jgi:hypothetical protein
MPPPEEPQLAAAELAALVAWVRRQSTTSTPPAAMAEAPATVPMQPATEPMQPAAGTGPDTSAKPEPATVPASAPAEEPPAQSQQRHAELLASLPASVTLWSDAVQPILAGKCGKCHSGDAAKAQLDVTSIEKLKTGGWSGPGVVAGKPADSLVLQRSKLPATDDDRMPPPGEPPIEQGELDLVEAWVALGAGAGTTAETRALSTAALEVLSQTLRAPRAEAAAGAKVEPGAGGCAACTVGVTRKVPLEALFATLLAGLALLLRRAAPSRR